MKMSDMESDDQSLLEYQEREYYEQEEVQELIKENGRLRAALREVLDAIDGPVYSAKRAEEARARAKEVLRDE